MTGGLPIVVTCSDAQMLVTGVTTGGVTPGKIQGIDCDIRLGTVTSTCRTRLTGRAGTSYSNSTNQLTFDRDHTELALTGSPTGVCASQQRKRPLYGGRWRKQSHS